MRPLAVLLLLASQGAAAPLTVRLATVAPDGTSWSRELKAFAREVEAASHGALQVKWYYGAIAGTEVEALQRIERGQLDGSASGGMMCQTIMPSLRVTRIQGLFRSREEASHAITRLSPSLEEEARRAGFTLLGTTGIGPEVVFTRQPVHTLAELRKVKLWRWDLDEVGTLMSRAIGLEVVPLPLEGGARAYDDGQIDGYISTASATLAFQWFTRARNLLNLNMSYLQGCLVVASRLFDRLTLEQQQIVRSSAVKLAVRMNDVARQTDEALLGGGFAGKGVNVVTASEALRIEFAEAARAARERLKDKLVPAALLERVGAILSSYRAEHGTP